MILHKLENKVEFKGDYYGIGPFETGIDLFPMLASNKSFFFIKIA
jgi:hypothetical protein